MFRSGTGGGVTATDRPSRTALALVLAPLPGPHRAPSGPQDFLPFASLRAGRAVDGDHEGIFPGKARGADREPAVAWAAIRHPAQANRSARLRNVIAWLMAASAASVLRNASSITKSWMMPW